LAFDAGTADEKGQWRRQAIRLIAERRAESGRLGVVAGHLSFRKNEAQLERVDAEDDWAAYTAIVYLNSHPSSSARWFAGDQTRQRQTHSAESLRSWQDQERQILPYICQQHGILLARLYPDAHGNFLTKGARLIQDLCIHNESYNMSQAIRAVGDFYHRTRH
jgi:hypothetical protein